MRDAANPVEPWFFIPHNSRRIVKSSTIRAQFPQTQTASEWFSMRGVAVSKRFLFGVQEVPGSNLGGRTSSINQVQKIRRPSGSFIEDLRSPSRRTSPDREMPSILLWPSYIETTLLLITRGQAPSKHPPRPNELVRLQSELLLLTPRLHSFCHLGLRRCVAPPKLDSTALPNEGAGSRLAWSLDSDAGFGHMCDLKRKAAEERSSSISYTHARLPR